MGPKFQIFVKSNSDKNFLQVIVPLWDQNFNFWNKCVRQFFSLTKQVSQHFTLIEAKKSRKTFSNHFFKKFYKFLSPYGTKISIFGKSVSDNFFHLQNMFHNISRWLKPKNRQKFFRTIFAKKFTSYCPPTGPKFQFLEKVCPTVFFTYKTFFTTFHVDWSQKTDKSFFEPFLQKSLQVIVPLRDQNFNFWKKCVRQFSLLTKHVSQHFTLIEAKKSTKIFSNQFFKIFYKLLSPYGTKISIFGKSVSDNFFHLQNMFHNISRWLKPKNRQKFFRTIFAKKFTSYCPPTGPKFQFLEKVCPTVFFTYKTFFTTFHVDWSQKTDKSFFEPFLQKSLQVIVPLRDQNFNFWKKCVRQFSLLTKHVSQHFTLIEAKKSTKIFSNQFFKIFYKLLSPYGTKISIFEKSVSDNFLYIQNMFHNISRWLKPRNRQKFCRTIFSKNLQVIVPLRDQNFNFCKK